MKKLFILLLILLTSPLSLASSNFVANDEPYYYYDDDSVNFRIIFSDVYRQWLNEVIHANRFYNKIYTKEFKWDLDEQVSLILASHRNQISNGFATVTPNSTTTHYIYGSDLVYNFAEKSWVQALLAHETAHLYQLNVKPRFASFLKSIFGNPISPLFLLPPYIHPNIFMPTYLLEGNATFNENRYGNAGRLYSGPARALVYALLNSPDFSLTSLINAHLDFPMTQEKYLVGGYYFYYLAQKYGVDKANELFAAYAHHIWWPFLIKPPHRRVYGQDHVSLFDNFKLFFKESKNQKQVIGPTLVKTFFNRPMNHTKDKIFFLSNEEFRADPQLNIYDKATKKLTQEVVNLDFGKLFYVNGRYVARSSNQVDSTNIKFSLFDIGKKPLSQYYNQYVHDIRAGQTAFSDVTQSYSDNKVFINNKFFGNIDSLIQFDNKGTPYYFKQKGSQRTLYKGKVSLYTYKGFYGKVVDIDEQGNVYFIANTQYGSTLYQASKTKALRLSEADTIVDAKHIKANEFLITQVTAKGYEYKVLKAQTSRSNTAPSNASNSDAVSSHPVHYKYPLFEKPEDNIFSHLKEKPDIVQPDKIKPYQALSQLRYGTLSVPGLATSSGGGLYIPLTLTMKDPLSYNEFDLTLASGYYGTFATSFNYFYGRYRWTWLLGADYTENTLVHYHSRKKQPSLQGIYYDSYFYTGFKYQLLTWREWKSLWSTIFSWENNDFININPVQNYGVENTFVIRRTRNTGRNYDAYRSFVLLLGHKMKALAPDWRAPTNTLVGKVALTHDLGYENLIHLWLTAGSSSYMGQSSSGLLISGNHFGQDKLEIIPKMSPGAIGYVNETKSIGLGYKKVINWSYYFRAFPLSLRRFAPYGRMNYFDLKQIQNSNKSITSIKNFTEYSLGVETELLLFHKFPFRLSFAQVVDTSQGSFREDYQLKVFAKQSFE